MCLCVCVYVCVCACLCSLACRVWCAGICACTHRPRPRVCLQDVVKWQQHAGLLDAFAKQAKEDAAARRRLRHQYAASHIKVSSIDLAADVVRERRRRACVAERELLSGDHAPSIEEEAAGEKPVGAVRYVPADLFNYRQFARQFFTRRPPLASETSKAKTIATRVEKVRVGVQEAWHTAVQHSLTARGWILQASAAADDRATARKVPSKRAKRRAAANPVVHPGVFKRMRGAL